MNLLINGLVVGAVYAIAASGLVVTYSTSGIFNFAHGALGMFCAYVYWEVRVNRGWPAPIALAFVLLVFAPLVGALLQRVIMRGLEGASEIVRLVIPISVLLALISLTNWVWKPTDPHVLQPFFGPNNTVRLGDVVLTYHDITIIIVSIALAVGLRVLLYQTRTGVAMRAVVDDRPLLQLNGGRPDRASLVSWMLGVSLSALAGIMITPFTGGSLSATTLTLLVINAFAAAMFGRLRSLPMTYAGALLLGLATRASFKRPEGLMPKNWDSWVANLRLAVPMLLLFVVLLVLPQDRLRGAVITRTKERFTLPSMQNAVVGGAVLVFCVFLLSRIMADTAVATLANGIGAAIIMLSLVLLVGYAGEMSLATMAFAAIGGIVLYHHDQIGRASEARASLTGYLLAIVVTALVGALVALPALRLRGLYLALATAAFSVAVEFLVMKELTLDRRIYPIVVIAIIAIGLASTYAAFRTWRWRGAGITAVVSAVVLLVAATNGWLQDKTMAPLFRQGSLSIPRPKMFGIDFTPQRNYLLLLATVFALLGVLLIALRRSAYGRMLTAMKDSPAACATLGLSLVRLKLSVFKLSAAIAGLGGCLFAGQIGSVTAERFSLFESLSMFMLVVVAGMGYVGGGFVGGLLYSAVFLTMQNIFGKLGADYPSFHGQFKWLASFALVMPALIGISLGRNPSGFVGDFYVGYGPMIRKVKTVFFAGVAVELLTWYLAFENHIGNWTFAIVTMVLVVVLPRVAMLVNPAAYAGDDAIAAEEHDVPLELIGVDRPFTDADVRGFDRRLGLAEGAAR
jgi:branched-subunit amino acid ABC-type transport system permease component